MSDLSHLVEWVKTCTVLELAALQKGAREVNDQETLDIVLLELRRRVKEGK